MIEILIALAVTFGWWLLPFTFLYCVKKVKLFHRIAISSLIFCAALWFGITLTGKLVSAGYSHVLGKLIFFFNAVPYIAAIWIISRSRKAKAQKLVEN